MPNGNQRLVLTPPPAGGGGKEKAARRVVWQRMPEAPLSAEEKKFVGSYRLRYTDSYRTKDGKEVFHGTRNETRAGTSYIIYTSSGHMMAHLMDREGRTKYAGAQPTPDEALKAYRSYSGYFGRFGPTRPTRHGSCTTASRARSIPELQRTAAVLSARGKRPEARRATEPQRRRRARGWAPVLGEAGARQVTPRKA